MLKLSWILCLMVTVSGHIKQNLDIDSMTGDEIAAMALEAKKDGKPQESLGPTLSYGFGGQKGPDPFEGLELPDDIRKEIETAVHDTMKKILEKAKSSKALRKVIRDELREQGNADGIATKELFGDFGWDIAAEEEDEDELDEFDESSYFKDEFDTDDSKKVKISNDDKPLETQENNKKRESDDKDEL